jgi:hypothetical protein
MVDVGEPDHQWASIPVRTLELRRQSSQGSLPVEDAGQLVGGGQRFDGGQTGTDALEGVGQTTAPG